MDNDTSGTKGNGRQEIPWLGGVERPSNEGAEGPPGVRWRNRTAQEEGRAVEAPILKRYGARPHPNSGAGRIKHDGSNELEVVEIKKYNNSFRLNAEYMLEQHIDAAKQGKNALLVIEFKNGIVAEIHIGRREQI